MANLNFGAAPAPAAAAAKRKQKEKLNWQPLTREELPPEVQELWDQTETAYQAAQPAIRELLEAEAVLQNALNESLKRAKSLPKGKALVLAYKKRYGKVAIAITDIEEAAKKTSGLLFK